MTCKTLSDSRLSVFGVHLPQEKLPSAPLKRLEIVAGEICDYLKTDGFEMPLSSLTDKDVTIYYDRWRQSKAISIEEKPIGATALNQVGYISRSLSELVERDLQAAVFEYVSLWKQIREYGKSVSVREGSEILEVQAAGVLEPEFSQWSKNVSHYSPILAVTGDVASLFKNTIKLIVGSKATAALCLGYLGQVFGLISSTSNLEKSFKTREYSVVIGDRRGVVQSLSLQVSSTIGFSSSFLGLSSKVCDLFNWSHVVTVFTNITSILAPISSVLSFARSFYRLERDRDVAQGLSNYTKNEKLSQKERLLGALKHLKSQLFVTSEEARHLVSDMEVEKLALRKKAIFQRVAGSSCVSNVTKEVLERHINTLQEEELLDLEEIQTFIETVETALQETKFKDQVYATLAIASLLALVGTYVATGGIPLAILILNAGVNLLIDTGHLELINTLIVPATKKLGLEDEVPELVAYKRRVQLPKIARDPSLGVVLAEEN